MKFIISILFTVIKIFITFIYFLILGKKFNFTNARYKPSQFRKIMREKKRKNGFRKMTFIKSKNL